MFAQFCTAHEIDLIIAVLFGVILSFSLGHALGPLLIPILRKVLKMDSKMTINIGAEADQETIRHHQVLMNGDRKAMRLDRNAMGGDRVAMAGDREIIHGLVQEPCQQYEIEHKRSLENQLRIKTVESAVQRIELVLATSIQDRKELRDFVEDINNRTEIIATNQNQVLGKLDMILKNAKITFS